MKDPTVYTVVVAHSNELAKTDLERFEAHIRTYFTGVLNQSFGPNDVVVGAFSGDLTHIGSISNGETEKLTRWRRSAYM